MYMKVPHPSKLPLDSPKTFRLFSRFVFDNPIIIEQRLRSIRNNNKIEPKTTAKEAEKILNLIFILNWFHMRMW